MLDLFALAVKLCAMQASSLFFCFLVCLVCCCLCVCVCVCVCVCERVLVCITLCITYVVFCFVVVVVWGGKVGGYVDRQGELRVQYISNRL